MNKEKHLILIIILFMVVFAEGCAQLSTSGETPGKSEKKPMEEVFPGSDDEQIDDDLVNAPGARIELEEPELDFGIMSPNDRIMKLLKIHNTGTETLHIRKVDSECYCTQIIDYDREIEPGKSGALQFMFIVQPQTGTMHKSIKLHTNDPGNTILKIRINADVREWYRIDPGPDLHLEAYQGQQLHRQLILRNMDDTDWTIMNVAKSLPFITIDVASAPRADCLFMTYDGEFSLGSRDFILTFSVSPHAPPGKFKGLFELLTSRKRNEIIRITVHGEIKRNVELSEQFVSMGKVSPKQVDPVKKEIEIFHVQHRFFKIIEIASTIPEITVHTPTKDRGSRYTITLEYSGGLPKGPYAGDLIITVDDGEQYELLARFGLLVE